MESLFLFIAVYPWIFIWKVVKLILGAREEARQIREGWNGDQVEMKTVDMSPLTTALTTEGANEWNLADGILGTLVNIGVRAAYKPKAKNGVDTVSDENLNL